MILAAYFIARYDNRLAAYNALQRRLMEHYCAQGGTPEQWCETYARPFRDRYGWMVDSDGRPTPPSRSAR